MVVLFLVLFSFYTIDIKNKHTFNYTDPFELKSFCYTVDGIEFDVKDNDLTYCMKNAVGDLFKSKADKV